MDQSWLATVILRVDPDDRFVAASSLANSESVVDFTFPDFEFGNAEIGEFLNHGLPMM